MILTKEQKILKNMEVMAANRARRRARALAGLQKLIIYRKRENIRHRAKQFGLLHPGSNKDIEFQMAKECLDRQADGRVYHIDHIIPLTSGGWHHHMNLQILPAEINISKNENPIWEKEGYKCWRDVPDFLWPNQLLETYRTLLNKSP